MNKTIGNLINKTKKNWADSHKKCIFAPLKKCAMASFEKLYNQIESNVKIGLSHIAELQQERDQLAEENNSLKNEIESLRKKINDKEEELKLLVVTNKVLHKEDITGIKRQINDWVREIDNCISLLKQK